MDKQPMTFDTAFVSVAKLIAQLEHPNLTPQADTEKKQKTKKPFDPQDIDAILTALNPAGEAAEEAPVIRKKGLSQYRRLPCPNPRQNRACLSPLVALWA
jgi:hypothetical protein